MAKFELYDFVKYGKLFDIYGTVLSEDRQAIMRMYFEFNMTLSEISKEKNISRQAVLDTIKKACKKLDEYENKLKFNSRIEEIASAVKEIAESKNITEVKRKVDVLLENI